MILLCACTHLVLMYMQSVRTFFRKNIHTCQEWLSHMSSSVVTIAIHAGMPAVAVRHGFAALKDYNKEHTNCKDVSCV